MNIWADDSYGVIMQSVSIDNMEVELMSNLSAEGRKVFFIFAVLI